MNRENRITLSAFQHNIHKHKETRHTADTITQNKTNALKIRERNDTVAYIVLFLGYEWIEARWNDKRKTIKNTHRSAKRNVKGKKKQQRRHICLHINCSYFYDRLYAVGMLLIATYFQLLYHFISNIMHACLRCIVCLFSDFNFLFF